MQKHLDLSAVEAFVLVADLRSFTRAADALGMTQAGISVKLQRLETQLGRRLLNRTPRQVRLSMEGDAFLPHAHALLAAQNCALYPPDTPARRLSLGISDYVAGPELPAILAKVNAYDPRLAIQVRVGPSAQLIKLFERGDIDVVIIRRQRHRQDDETLFEDRYGWFGALSTGPCSPLPLVTVDDDCGVRATAVSLLAEARIDWVDTFIGGGVAATLGAAAGGIGVAPLPHRLASVGLMDVGKLLGLPPLPVAEVAMRAHPVDLQTKSTLRVLAAAFRGHVDEQGARTDPSAQPVSGNDEAVFSDMPSPPLYIHRAAEHGAAFKMAKIR